MKEYELAKANTITEYDKVFINLNKGHHFTTNNRKKYVIKKENE